MRTILLVIILGITIATKAQAPAGVGFMDYIQQESFGNYNHAVIGTPHKNWFFSTYTGFSTSFHFFNGGNASIMAVPVGIQLNRRLNDNLFAFAGVSVAPSYINFNRSLLSSPYNKGYQRSGIFDGTNFGINSRVEMGLMYINDAKTFSVSGSVNVQTSSYPLIPYQQTVNSHNAGNVKY